MSEAEEIVLSELTLEDLYELMKEDLYDGLAEEIVAEVHEALGRGEIPYDVLTKGLVAGMQIVGNDFRDGILFVPEVLMAAKAMKAGMFILRPLLAETGAQKIGSMVIGTVKGDIHDIGKNLVTMMMEGAGFEVYRPGDQQLGRELPGGHRETQPRYPGHERAADHDHALYESRHRQHSRKRASARTSSSSSAGRRSTRRLPRRSKPTPTAAMPRWRSRRPRSSCTSARVSRSRREPARSIIR